MAQILNIAGYKFISLTALPVLQANWKIKADSLQLKGTLLMSPEGINVMLAGAPDAVREFIDFLREDARFTDITFRESYSDFQPFERMKVKIKKEIITLRQPDVSPVAERAPSISPQQFKDWLDADHEMVVLDTRNDYEYRFGTFAKAVNLQLTDFGQFPAAVDQVDKQKPVVMFCTGGIRCEKAALVMQKKGFTNVYQLEGGILNYFSQVGGAHYTGECFVFDRRVGLDAQLLPTRTVQCGVCHGPVTLSEQELPEYVPDVSCPSCIN